jgi:hypothetical protein
MTPGYDYFDVEADVGIIGRGNTAAEAFVQTALGVFALIVEPASVEPRDRREVRAHAETLEALLVTWVNECLYVHEVEGFVARDVDLEVFETSPRAGGEPLRLHCSFAGRSWTRLDIAWDDRESGHVPPGIGRAGWGGLRGPAHRRCLTVSQLSPK